MPTIKGFFFLKKEDLNKLEAFKTTTKKGKDRWVIKLDKGFLHFIETVDNSPFWLSNPNMTMINFQFEEQAVAVCNYLRKLWDEERIIKESKSNNIEFFDKFEEIDVEVKIS